MLFRITYLLLTSRSALRGFPKKDVRAYLNKIGIKKATGLDKISPKILHMVKDVVIKPITDIVNKLLKQETFPDRLKIARVIPLYKKKDPLDRQYYRPVSVHPNVSKIFERAVAEQMSYFFKDIFNPKLSAFRRGYSCQSTLLALTEKWRAALDRNEYVAAVLMDLSKAFDCLPHALIVEKLKAYGLTDGATNLLKSYLSNRKQCVQLGSSTSIFFK